MRLITIEKKGEVIKAYDGADRRLHREFTVTGQVDFYLKGAFTPDDYDTARLLALNICHEMHIPAMMLKRVMPVVSHRGREIDPSQKSFL